MHEERFKIAGRQAAACLQSSAAGEDISPEDV